MISSSLFYDHLMVFLPGRFTTDNCCEFNDCLNPREWYFNVDWKQ